MRPLLVASIGNPGRLATTLHSAGHTILQALVEHAHAPRFQKRELYPGSSVSRLDSPHGTPTVFWQSPNHMNISGPAVFRAWKAFLRDISVVDQDPHLVILHDELELRLGDYKLSTGAARSARGHNGLKNILGMPILKKSTFSRVGVGIGPRPECRDAAVVADFVMREMKPLELHAIRSMADRIWLDLENLRSTL